MTTIYERLGVRTWINANGYLTRLGGCLLSEHVLSAMQEAAGSFVSVEELQAAASRVIVQHTGAEAGIVTSGGAAALAVGTAACLTGFDASKMNRLPDTSGMANEVVMHRGHRWGYDHAIRAAGARIVEFGFVESLSGVGIRGGLETWEMEAAITERTVACAFMAAPHNFDDLDKAVEVASRHKLPVIVDASPWLPPINNLRRFIDAGASLVAFSGGKALCGPQGTGILCGERDLIAAAVVQQLDMSIIPETWAPPNDLIPREKLIGVPNQGIGRTMKVSKEDIVGLIVALEDFVGDDHDRKLQSMAHILTAVNDGISNVSHIRTVLSSVAATGRRPLLEVHIDEGALGTTAPEVSIRLKSQSPPIQVNERRMAEGVLILDAAALKNEHIDPIVAGLIQSLS